MLFSPNGGCVEIERNLLQSVVSPDIHIAQQIACARVISDSRICNDFPCIGGNFLKGRIIRANLFKVYCPLIRTFSLIGYFFNFHNIPGIRNYCIITICYDDKLIIKIGDLEQSPKQNNIIIKQIIYNAVGFIYNFLENENRNRNELPLWMSNYLNTSALHENIGKKNKRALSDRTLFATYAERLFQKISEHNLSCIYATIKARLRYKTAYSQ